MVPAYPGVPVCTLVKHQRDRKRVFIWFLAAPVQNYELLDWTRAVRA